MSLLYPNENKVEYDVEITQYKDKTIEFFFTCNGGKFGTDEPIASFNLTPQELLTILQSKEE